MNLQSVHFLSLVLFSNWLNSSASLHVDRIAPCLSRKLLISFLEGPLLWCLWGYKWRALLLWNHLRLQVRHRWLTACCCFLLDTCINNNQTFDLYLIKIQLSTLLSTLRVWCKNLFIILGMQFQTLLSREGNDTTTRLVPYLTWIKLQAVCKDYCSNCSLRIFIGVSSFDFLRKFQKVIP